MINYFKRLLFKKEWKAIQEKEKELALARADIDNEIGRRVARYVLDLDVFEPMMRKYNGVFAHVFERPEDSLDQPSLIALEMWGWQQSRDASFKYLMEWIMNKQGNLTLKAKNLDAESILFGRAMIAIPLAIVEQVKRLAANYDARIEASRQGFDPYAPVSDR